MTRNRIEVYQYIGEALRSLNWLHPGDRVSVYTGDDFQSTYKPNSDECPEVNITKVVWVLSPASFRYKGLVEVTNIRKTFNLTTARGKFEYIDWEWKWIEMKG